MGLVVEGLSYFSVLHGGMEKAVCDFFAREACILHALQVVSQKTDQRNRAPDDTSDV